MTIRNGTMGKLGFLMRSAAVGALMAACFAGQSQASGLDYVVELDRTKVLSGESVPVYMMVKMTARPPTEKAEDRPSMNLSLVLDRSGSMEGRGKLDYVKKAASLVVQRLNNKDVLSVVEYDDEVTVLWPSSPVEAPNMIERLINELDPRGSTDLVGGMMRGVEQVEKGYDSGDANDQAVSRVLLLSDGLANRGVTDPHQIRQMVRAAKRQGIRISTLGLGADYDEDLMQDIAENAGGNYYYIENPNQMGKIFERELDSLFNTVVKNCSLTFEPANDVTSVEAIGTLSTKDDMGTKVELGNFYGSEKQTVLLKLEFDPKDVGSTALGELHSSCEDVETGEKQQYSSQALVEITHDEEAVKEAINQEVVVEATLVETERKHAEIIKLYEAGQHDEADRQMKAVADRIEQENATLNDVRLANKLQAVNVEREEMKQVASAPGEQSQYLKRTKQRLFKAQKGQRSLYLLQVGDKGPEVEQLEVALKEAGYFSGDVDGEFDAALSDAVEAFQKDKSLGVDGMAGPATMKELGLY